MRGMGFLELNGSCLEHEGLAFIGTTGTGTGTETGTAAETGTETGTGSRGGGLPNTDSYNGYTHHKVRQMSSHAISYHAMFCHVM